jgi:hypothetical protein
MDGVLIAAAVLIGSLAPLLWIGWMLRRTAEPDD